MQVNLQLYNINRLQYCKLQTKNLLVELKYTIKMNDIIKVPFIFHFIEYPFIIIFFVL